jgi:hypothetical protein
MKEFRVHGQVLAPHIHIDSAFDSPAAAVLGNKRVTLVDSLLPTLIYPIYRQIWG